MKYALLIYCIFYSSFKMKAQERQYHVLFEFNKIGTPDSSMVGLIRIIATNSIEKVLIEGHCDSIGQKGYNDVLSEMRANEVKKLLIQNGMDKNVIKRCIGYGEDRPLTTNSSEEERQQNRRVTVHFYLQTPVTKDTFNVNQPLEQKDFKAGRKIVLKDIFFYGGRHILKPESIPVLQNLGDILKANPTMKIDIQGHVCCTSIESDGFDIDTGLDNLSVARAEMVYIYLVQKCGIRNDRLSYRGYGGTRKITQHEESEELQQINRRVEINVLEE